MLSAIVSLLLLLPPAPLESQLPVLKKVLQFEHGWEHGKHVLVVGATGDDANALEVARQFAELGVKARVVALADLNPAGDVIAVYIARSVAPEKVTPFARKHGYLSMSWRPDDVEAGRASVAIGRNAADKPEILINLTSLKAEGRMFNARVLRIAQVIP